MKTSNLEAILSATKSIDWTTETVRQKAIQLVSAIFNQYTRKGTDLNVYLNLSKQYFKTIIPGKDSHIVEIKSKLLSNNILITNNSYNVNAKIGKGFKFNSSYINSIHLHTFSPYHICGTLFESLDIKGTQSTIIPHINRLKINDSLAEILTKRIIELSTIDRKDIKLNEEITDQYIYITLNKKYRYGIAKAIELAKTMGVDLIKFKDKYYLELLEDFMIRKPKELKLCYSKKIFDIKNECFYIGRNETNNRLDYNLTSLNKELFKFIEFDGEELVELDIANAQFVIASFINPNIDTSFISLSQSGSLYEHIGQCLNITEREAKGLMFRVAFDKVKSDTEFDAIREMFPLFMAWVDSYKKDNGYKLFSNLLQKSESNLMIDGLYSYLLSKGYETFPVHDAIRVKQSQLNEIKNVCIEFFNTMKFKCTLRDKNKNS